MRSFLKSVSLLLPLLLIGFSGKLSADEGKAYQIVVIPKGNSNIYWKTIHAGVAKAAKDLGTEVSWVAPVTEGDTQEQIRAVQNAVSQKADAIVLAPLDSKALVEPVEAASKAGVPVVIIDSALDSDAQASFVATNNKEGGRKGADRLGVVMGGTGKVLMLRYVKGSASTTEREEGFLEEMDKKYPDITVVSSDQYTGATQESAQQASLDILEKFPEVQGIFCPNQTSVLGMLQALKASGKAGKVKFVGFDTGRDQLEGLKDGDLNGLIAQDPFTMGYEGLQAAVDHLKGKKVEPLIATRLLLVTQENMDDPKVKKVISPDLDKWLK